MLFTQKQRYWELLEKERRTVRLHGLWGEEVPEKPAQLLKTAKGGQFRVPKKLNAHFAHFLECMKSRAFAVCDPGPIVLAQFIDDLGVCEALQVYGPKRSEGSEITNLVLLNVCRILAGYETVGHLNGNRALAVLNEKWQCFGRDGSAILIMEIVLILQANMECLHDGYRN